MKFSNSYISKENIEKFDIKNLDEKFSYAHYKPNWTVNETEDIYLRYVGCGREDESANLEFNFYWRGYLFYVCLFVESGGRRDAPQWRHYKLLRFVDMRQYPFEMGIFFPPDLDREVVLGDMKDALLAYRDFGVLSNATEFSVKLNFEGGR